MIPTFDSLWAVMAVFGAGAAAGAANAVAGGGSALAFPVLVLVGVPPIAANATSALGLWPGSVAAAWSYRARIRHIRRRTRWLIPPAMAGGLLGGWLLIELPPSWFAAVAPWLVIGAALSVGVEPGVRTWLRRRPGDRGDVGDRGDRGYRAGRTHRAGAGFAAITAMFLLSIYGGYFGAGMGLILLTTLGLLGLEDLQHANGIKNLIAVVIKAPAIVYFVAIGAARWDASLVMALGAISGGWLAGHLIQKVDASRLRWLIALIGLSLGALMLVRP